MEGGEERAGGDGVGYAGGRGERAAAGDDAHRLAVAHGEAAGVLRVHFDERARLALVQLWHFARARAGVPLVFDAAGEQRERVRVVELFGGLLVADHVEARFAVGRGELSVGEEADGGGRAVFGRGPLDALRRCAQALVAEPG